MNAVRWLRRLPFFSTRTPVGSDPSGNQYFILKEGKRVVFPPSGDESSFDLSTVPVQWQAWLSGSKAQPPTTQELTEAETQQAILSRRVAELEQEHENSEFARKEKLASAVHSASKSFNKDPRAKQSAAPDGKKGNAGPAGTFEPDSWVPGK
eukprot:m.76926 g.76926  ORF g.76926 m.76926 type:complete len:152 (-) comp20638_c0_seq2:21-476(-)